MLFASDATYKSLGVAPIPDPIHNIDCLKLVEDSMAAVGEMTSLLDQLAGRATPELEVPIALITLVSAEEQFFKGEFGLPATLAVLRKTPINYSICQFTVRDSNALPIPDIEIHPLVKDHPSVRDMGIRAYLGIPLQVADPAISSLSFVDYMPRRWNPDQLAQAEALAAEIVQTDGKIAAKV